MRRVVFFTVVYCLVGVVFGKAALDHDESKPVSIESVPFLASLVDLSDGGVRHFCSASVIHDKFLVTAASCFDGRDSNQTKVLVGSNSRTEGALYDVDLLLPHKKYFKQTGDYNVGLVKLKKRLEFSSKVDKVKVGRKKVKTGSWVDVVGWGSAPHNSSSGLRQTSIPVLSPSACRGGLGRIVRRREYCAGVPGEGRGDCVSEEGSPVFAHSSLVGVGSAFTGCGRLPGLYTRLDAVRGWVTATIDKHISYLDYIDEAAAKVFSLVGVGSAFTGCGRLPGLYTRLDAVRGWVTATIDKHISYLDYIDEAAAKVL